MSTSALTITTFQLSSGDGWLQTTLTCPNAARARCAVLICPPLVEERKAAQRNMVDAARYLSQKVPCVVLRIDYRGCGDSAGGFEDYAVGDWLADIAVASEWLAEHFPDLPQVRLGVRVGALFALQPPAPSPLMAASIFWEPVEGLALIKQLLQRHMVNDMIAYGRAQVSRQELKKTLSTGGCVDLDGYTFTGSQFTQLEACTFPKTSQPLLAIVTGPDTRTLEMLRTQATDLTAASIRLPPFWNSVGHVETEALAETSAQWLQKRFTAPPQPISPTLDTVPETCDTFEKPLAIRSRAGIIRAILHRPAVEPHAGAFLFLGGWSGDRQGPHRLFLDMARQLTHQGSVCLRIDYRGRGESAAPEKGAGIATMIDDADAAVSWLKTELPAKTPITLIAICSGCKVAIGTATRHPDIQRLVLWSAEVMGHLRKKDANLRKTLGALQAYGKKLTRRETWGKLLSGKVQAGMVGKALVKHETRSAEEARVEDEILMAFSRYRGRLYFIYGGSDPDAAPASQAYKRFCRRHKIEAEMDVIPYAGHSYYGVAWRKELMEQTHTWLASSDESAAPVSRSSK